jgi:hypothetical protein
MTTTAKPKFKKGDVLISRDNKILQYVGEFEHPELGKIAEVRIYRTNRHKGIRFEDVKLHPFFS